MLEWYKHEQPGRKDTHPNTHTHTILITCNVTSSIIEVFRGYIGTIEESVLFKVQSFLGFSRFGKSKRVVRTHSYKTM